MAMTQATLGAGRVGLKKLFAIESEQVEKQYLDVVGGRVTSTNQTSEVFKQMIGLGPSTQTPEGSKVDYDDMEALYTMLVKPLLYTKGIKFSKQTEYTDQYGVLKGVTPDFARAFMERRNVNVADLDNSGFSASQNGGLGYGQNGEPLYSASHSMGSLYGYNRPLAPGQTAGTSATTLDVAFGPLALEQCYTDLRGQKSARGLPFPPQGKIDVKVPYQLYPQAERAITALRGMAGTNNNDPNFNRKKFNDPKEILYYTSSTAWFAMAADKKYHGLFFLEQMPYDIEQLPPDEEVMVKWVAYESWAFGWYDWHGTWGTQGA
jgi:hypothetical protein